MWYQALLPGGAIDAALRRLDGGAGGAGGAADDINEERAFFSYEHFYVLYCSFCSLDEDGDPRSGRRILVSQPALERTRTQPCSATCRCIRCARRPSYSRGALKTLLSTRTPAPEVGVLSP